MCRPSFTFLFQVCLPCMNCFQILPVSKILRSWLRGEGIHCHLVTSRLTFSQTSIVVMQRAWGPAFIYNICKRGLVALLYCKKFSARILNGAWWYQVLCSENIFDIEILQKCEQVLAILWKAWKMLILIRKQLKYAKAFSTSVEPPSSTRKISVKHGLEVFEMLWNHWEFGLLCAISWSWNKQLTGSKLRMFWRLYKWGLE